MHKGRGGKYDSESQDRVVLTHEDAGSSIVTGSNDDRPKQTVASRLLAPLREGKPVALVVDDPRLPKRKRIEKPMLFLTPITVYGQLSTKLMVALQTYGCEVIDTRETIKPAAFFRMGMNGKLAAVLAEELNLVFRKGDSHGTTET